MTQTSRTPTPASPTLPHRHACGARAALRRRLSAAESGSVLATNDQSNPLVTSPTCDVCMEPRRHCDVWTRG